jgi:hypothetical protein
MTTLTLAHLSLLAQNKNNDRSNGTNQTAAAALQHHILTMLQPHTEAQRK